MSKQMFLRGLVAAKRGDLEAALRDMRRANELKPGSFMLAEMVRHLMCAGQEYGDWGRSVYAAMLPVDPLNPLNWVQQASFHRGAGELVEAERAARRALELAERLDIGRHAVRIAECVPGACSAGGCRGRREARDTPTRAGRPMGGVHVVVPRRRACAHRPTGWCHAVVETRWQAFDV